MLIQACINYSNRKKTLIISDNIIHTYYLNSLDFSLNNIKTKQKTVNTVTMRVARDGPWAATAQGGRPDVAIHMVKEGHFRGRIAGD